MDLNDVFDLVSKTTDENYTNLRKLTDLNLKVWDQLAGKQMEVMKLYFETGNKQVELAKDAKRVDELYSKQAELARELGEQLIERNQQVMEILNKSREEYKDWVEAGTAQAKTRMEQVTQVKAHEAA